MHYEQLKHLRDKISHLNDMYEAAEITPTKNNIYKQLVAASELLKKLIEDTIQEEKISEY